MTTYLQSHVAVFMNNDLNNRMQVATKSGRPLKTIQMRLKGKEGRIRGNLMGKRVDFSARTVITADPNLSIDQVGVPRSVALTLTVPVRVTHFNQSYMEKLVENGTMAYPGAKFIIRSDGTRIDLSSRDPDRSLMHGDIVERHLCDDDAIVFNRQPSLHKMSIMGHRAKILDFSTFRLNLSCTSPYNADFDGDEMNLHVPQSLTARAEVELMMLSPRVIVSGQSNKPVMGIIQDSLLGTQKMTKRDVFIEKDVVMNILMWVTNWNGHIPNPCILKPKPLWSGKQMFSLICPKINLKTKGNTHPDQKDIDAGKDFNTMNLYDSEVVITNGQLMSGIVDKKTIGSGMGGLIHTSWLDVGFEETMRFFNQAQQISNYWVLQKSFSIGVVDTIADKKTMIDIEEKIDQAKSSVKALVQKAQAGKLEVQPGKTMMQSFEAYVKKALDGARDGSGKSAQKSLTERNSVKAMVTAGSKGSYINISQIIACVGQQGVEGQRIPFGFKKRTLPHFMKDDFGPESRGFVENSYLRGLSAQEFFFHAMGGREGLIDTACKTSETGYIQRRLVKAMETVMSRYDGTLRTSNGSIVQFLYGEDGMDAVWIEKQAFPSLTMKESKFASTYKMDTSDEQFGTDDQGNNYLQESVIQACRDDPNVQLELDNEYEQLKQDQSDLRIVMANRGTGISVSNDMSYAPGNIKRLIGNAMQQFSRDKSIPTDLHPVDVMNTIKQFVEKDIIVVGGSDTLAVEAQRNATSLYAILIRSMLSSKRVVKEYRLSSTAFNWVLQEIKARFHKAKINPGEATGVLAAQSIGEPATQMTLNTFHYAGVSAKNVTLGVPRLKEIMSIAKSPKTPGVTIFLKEEYEFKDVEKDADGQYVEEPGNDYWLAEKMKKNVMARLENLVLKDLVSVSEIYYDPIITETVVEADKDLIEGYYEIRRDDSAEWSPWLLRFELDEKMFQGKEIQMSDFEKLIEEEYGEGNMQVVCSDQTDDTNRVIRIRIQNDGAGGGGQEEGVEEGFGDEEGSQELDVFMKRLEKNMLEKLRIKGIPSITKVYDRKENKTKWEDEKGFSNIKEWVIDTDGSSLMAVFSDEDVDFTRTYTNDIVETFEVLGIEGVRGALLSELRNVISFDGSYVNYRHLACLVDVMTMSGGLMAIDRHGINGRPGNGPLLKASFEETVDMLMESACYAEEQKMVGVTENIMMGSLAKAGTGDMDLILDVQAVEKNAMSEGAIVDGAEDDQGNMFGAQTPSNQTPYTSTPFASSPENYTGTDGYGDSENLINFSPAYVGGSGGDVTTSPMYNDGSGGIGGRSPGYAAGGGGASSSPGYSPSSPAYSPSSPAYSPSSPAYSPSSPAYSPSSPAYSPSSPAYSPSSPAYSPSSPAYSPSSPAYSPSSPAYSPSSPAYSPSSPAYSPSSPAYSPSSPAYSPSSPAYSPSSPAYSPTSPGPDDDEMKDAQ